MYFCYDCRVFIPGVEEVSPKVELPVFIDIVKHRMEKNGKSTAIHCLLTAPLSTRIIDDFEDIPDYTDTTAFPNTVLVYPSKNAISIDEYVRTNGPIRRFVFIDATWYTVGSIRNQRSISALPTVILKNYETQYWRPQKGCSNTYLATIEAIYYAVIENWQTSQQLQKSVEKYDGRFDNLLYWFFYFRSKVNMHG
uniref:tRNA-uridine aminocarboxypropyltransferase 1 n=1 Tax=Acrobeloides nanus TaxID=290746 RepID=A0A914BWL1_9BILA